MTKIQDPKPPRGIFNCNPGNIKKSKIEWEGLADIQRDKTFATFSQPIWGLRAMMKILLTYYRIYKLDTVHKIINRWAPEIENPTGEYIEYVCDYTFFRPDEVIDVREYDTLVDLAQAIVLFENGKPKNIKYHSAWYREELYEQAAILALQPTKGK